MAVYEPLRDSFREFNRMIIDAQQFDAMHEQRAMDNRMKNTILMGDLKQRAFNNEMTVRAANLADKREDRAALALSQQILNQNRNYLAGREDAQSNRSLALQSGDRANAHLALAQEDAKRKGVTQDLNQKLLRDQVENVEFMAEETPLDFRGLVDADLLANNDFMSELNNWAGEMGLKASTEGTLHNQDGSPAVMKRKFQAQFAPVIQNLAVKYENRHATMTDEVNALQDRKKNLQTIISGSDNYNIAQKAQARREINAINPQLEERAEFFTTRGQLRYQADRIGDLQSRAAWFRQRGAEKQAASMDKQANAHLQIYSSLVKQVGQAASGSPDSKGLNMVPLFRQELTKDGKAINMGQAVFDKQNNIFKIRKKDGEEVEIPALALQDAGLTTVKPTESFSRGGAGGGPRGLMTEKQMLNFEDVYQSEGMAAMFASQEATGMKSTLSNLTNSIFDQMGAKEEDRRRARFAAMDLQQRSEVKYQDFVAAIPNFSNVERANKMLQSKQLVNHLLNQAKERKLGQQIQYYTRKLKQLDSAKKERDQIEALKETAFLRHEATIRSAMDNPRAIVYRPNSTTGQMIFGQGITGQGN
jgi:hypothetical protein